MSAKKRIPGDGAALAGQAGSRRGVRLLMGASIVVLLCGSLGLAVWRHVSPHVLGGEQYQVHPEHIAITAPPQWILPDEGSKTADERIKSEVLRDVIRVGPLSLLDNDLTVRLAGAFASHPWVARVDRVSKRFPSGVDVSLAYRMPVAMVELHDGSGVLPIDEQAVLLPTRDFSVEQAENYPRIAEIYTSPPPVVGTRWGDAAVLGGAQIAAVLANDWKSLHFARIVPVERKPARSGFEYTYRLFTHSGTTVDWGRAPGTDLPGEVPATEKIAQLNRYVAANNGTLDGPDGPQPIEFDNHGALLRKSQPAVAPLPPVEEARTRSPREDAPHAVEADEASLEID